MTLFVELKSGEKIFESVRAVNKNNNNLIFYRESFYPGEKYSIELDKILTAFVITEGKEIKIV